MSKYIDVEKLLSFVKDLEYVHPYVCENLYDNAYYNCLQEVKDFISSHLKEPPEVDLEKELIQWHKCHFKKVGTYEKYSGFYLQNSSQLDLARYFYKIGLSARKEVDIEKEIQEHIKECLDIKFPTTDIEQIKKDVAYTARKFYELGLNAREK